MFEFKILSLKRHSGGFGVAVVKSFRDQNEYTLHNRYGSWMVGDPDSKGTMREAAVISGTLAAALQEHWTDKKVTIEDMKPVNPFIRKAAKTNPMIAKLLASGRIS